MEIKILTFNKLGRLIDKLKDIFAPKSIENEIIKSEISLEQPQGQSINDIWFVEHERN